MSVQTSTRRPDRPDSTLRPDHVGRPAARAAVRAGVPWKTVVALAVVLSFADGAWLTSLHGAVGAIERTQSPFLSWSQESTALLPLFAAGVLAALMLAMRWFGPVLHRPRTVIATVALVAVAGTVLALAVSAASSVYDYRLQSQQMLMMASMRSRCLGDCLANEQHATLVLHVRAFVYLSRWLLLTNLVLVGWLVEMWGAGSS